MEDREGGRRNSEVLDAIFDKVADKPQRNAAASSIFRAKALEQLDVPAEIDSQLPLVPRRSWLLLLGLGILVLGFGLWASSTPSVTSVSAPGRAVAQPGAVPVAATATGVVTQVDDPGVTVTAGDPVARIRTEERLVDVQAAVDGAVWQQDVVAGQTVIAGQTVVVLLPTGSSDNVMLAVPEQQAVTMAPGMMVTFPGDVQGSVSAVGAPLDAAMAGSRTGLKLADSGLYCLVTVSVDRQLPAGALVNGVVVLSDGTVLTRLLGRP